MKPSFILYFLLLASSLLSAQNFEWSGHIGGDQTGTFHQGGLAADPEGNVYMSGHFQGSVNADFGAGATPLSATNTDAYVLKVAPDGSVLWAAVLSGNFETYGVDLAVAPDGGVVVTGHFVGAVDFDPGPGVQSITAQGVGDLFVLKLTSAGKLQWVRTFHEDSDFPFTYAHALSVGAGGMIAVAGEFAGSMTLREGPSPLVIESVNNENDYFLFAMDFQGQVLWGRAIGSDQSEGGLGGKARSDVACGPDGSVHMIGLLKGEIVFEAGDPDATLSPAGLGNDLFVLRCQADGSLDWVRRIGGPENESYTEAQRAACIAVDPDGGLRIAGLVTGEVTLDVGVTAGFGFGTNGFVARLEEDGTALWARTMQAQVQGIAVDAGGALFCTGFAGDGSNMDVGYSNQTLNYISFYAMPYLARFAESGDLTFLGGFDAPSPNQAQTGYGVGAGGGSVYAAGVFYGQTDFDPGAAQSFLTPFNMDGQGDAYLVRFSSDIPDCTPAQSATITADAGPVICVGDTVTFQVSGSLLNDNTDWVWMTGVDCDGELLGIGATLQVAPLVSSGYSVRGAGGCRPGPCQSLNITVEVCTGIEGVPTAPARLQYLAPGSILRVHADTPATLVVVDLLGRELLSQRLSGDMQDMSLHYLLPGMYIAILDEDRGGREVLRFIR